jgi:predicted permease
MRRSPADRIRDGWSEIRHRVRAIVHRRTVERELDDELQFHIEKETEKLIAAGIDPAEARRQARLAFGGFERIKDDIRDVHGVSWLETFASDLRYAARAVRSRPTFTAAVVLTLGLGIGANVAMFGIVDQLLLRVPPYLRDPARVHRIYLSYIDGEQAVTETTTEYARYLDLTRLTKTLDAAAVVSGRNFAVGVGEDAREMPVGIVSASFWGFFDARPALGRYFTASEDSVPTGSPVVVLSYAYWQAQYGGSPNVIGQSVQIGPVPCTIVGVTPPGFTGIPDEGVPVAYIPATLYGFGVSLQRGRIDYHTTYNWGWLSVIARRKAGVTIAETSADLTNAFRLSWEAQRAMSPIADVSVAKPRAAAESIVRERGPNASPVAKVALWIAGVASIVLLIACANVANLLLARALSRQREMALRVALGASRRRLIGQHMTESLLLGALGGVAGIAAAQWGGAILWSLFLDETNRTSVVGDGRTLAFAGVAALVAALLIGLAPAWQAGRASLAPSLKTGVRDGTYQRSRTRTILLVLQGALSVVLLVGAGLFVRSLNNVRAVRLGFDVDPVLLVSPNLRGMALSQPERAELVRRLVEEARALPEVTHASRGISVPFYSTESLGFFVPGVDSIRKLGRFSLQMASEKYFETMGTRVIRGRAFTAADRADGQLVAIVSEGMAAAVWPGQDALGKCIMLDKRSAPCRVVVGIAENIRQRSLTERETLQWYLAIEQIRPDEAKLFVRTRGNAADHVETIRRRLQRTMPGSAYVVVTPMRDILDPRQRAWKLGATMFAVFGALALVLAAIGLYSVIAYTVAQRTQEIGVRIALGARLRDVVRLVVGEGIRFAVVGIVLGGAVALWASRWVGPLLFSVSPKDPAIYGAVAAVLLGAALLASAIPAVRASRVDPNVALRSE